MMVAKTKNIFLPFVWDINIKMAILIVDSRIKNAG
jgi:hypothetical protein